MKKIMTKNDKTSIPSIPKEIIQEAILYVKKLHYLGYSNKAPKQTGDLNGFYCNISRKVMIKQLDTMHPTTYDPYIILNAASLFEAGVGNCGEICHAVYITLMQHTKITSEQKKAIKIIRHRTNDNHEINSYLVTSDTIYDIFDDKEYTPRNFAKKMRSYGYKYETISLSEKFLDDLLNNIKQRIKIYHGIFKQLFESEIISVRKKNLIYPTFDETDGSLYAIFAHQAFNYLSAKFTELFTDHYYLEQPELSENLKDTILKDFIFLITELRQDHLLVSSVANKQPGRIKYSCEEVATTLYATVAHQNFATYILALTYQATDKTTYSSLLANLHETLKVQTNPIDVWLLNRIAKIITSQNIDHTKELMQGDLTTTEEINSACSNILNLISRSNHPIYNAQETTTNPEQKNSENNNQNFQPTPNHL